MTQHYVYQTRGRNPRTALTVAGVWCLLAVLYIRFDAAPWVLAIVAAFTLPALWDLLRNPPAGLEMNDTTLLWFSGARDAQIPWSEIKLVRLDTRLDLSVRATVVLTSGRRVRAPFEATPPADTLEFELKARDIPVERHHFSLLG